ncbi:YciI family protein [Rhodococcus sp. IEGM 1379]|uniref:YciI family protein n=1 Tax=Rhodococcus sp. IEGM 1379 TaxID=3047086 RepID=UPI0024B6EA40|nr:YciI family protein [Rhodococcus sp. IEGM 1379]MDI9919238.1 YciI family protein [Rhodococcus sp. IEGM 1379]
MKYMLIMRSTDQAIEAAQDMDFDAIITAMGQYNESLIKAGVLLAGEGLAMEEGFIVDFDADPPLVSDGPYGETKELFSGFWIIQTSTKDEALEWAKRCPLGPGSKLEVRRVSEMEEFDQSNEYVQKEADWRDELGTDRPVTS